MLKMTICISFLSLGLLGADTAFCEAYNTMNPKGYKVAIDLIEMEYGSNQCDPDKIKMISNSSEYQYLLSVYTLDPSRYQALMYAAKQSGSIKGIK